MNYHNKKFRAVNNSENGEVDANMIFHYEQLGNILSCTYTGGQIAQGHLLGTVSDDGILNFCYHQINTLLEIKTGICRSTPEVLPNGKIRLHESWQWTSGDNSKGNSILEEL